MTDTQGGRLDIDELMKRVRKEVELRRAGRDVQATAAVPADLSPATRPSAAPPVVFPRVPAAGSMPAPKDSYTMAELLVHQDLDFVRAAYVAVLGREPEPEAALVHADKLRTGALTKIELLGNLRFSQEGRANRVRVHGLVLPYAVQQALRIPIAGRLLAIGIAMLRLPAHMRSVQRLETHVFRQQREQGTVFDQLATTAELSLQKVTADVAVLLDEQAAQRRALDAANSRMDAMRDGIVWRAEHDHLRAVAESLGSNVETLLARLATAEQRGEQLDVLVSEIAALKATAARSDTARDALGQRLEELERAAAALRDATTSTRAADRADIDASLAASAGVHEAIAAVWARIAELDGAKSKRADEDRLDLLERIELLARELAAHRRNMVELDRRLVSALAAREPSLPASERTLKETTEAGHALDAFYAAFEEEFRGSREDIATRAQFYVPIVEQALAGLPDAPVLDVGCGRGEWLELLRNAGRVGQGVDLNRVFVEDCRARGLDVIEAEALGHLRRLPSNSIGAITAMHFVEHVEFETLVAFFDECFRVLRPGGVIAFETPNPENLLTASYFFYYDPTHRHPLPPPLLKFIAEARGFGGVEIHRLSEARGFTPPAPIDAASPNAGQLDRVLELLRAAPDYALVARKT